MRGRHGRIDAETGKARPAPTTGERTLTPVVMWGEMAASDRRLGEEKAGEPKRADVAKPGKTTKKANQPARGSWVRNPKTG